MYDPVMLHPTQGIGDSGQGIVNAFLFVLLTKPVRDSFLQPICCTKGKGKLTEKAESCDTALLVNDEHDSRLSYQISHNKLTDSDAATPDPVTTSVAVTCTN